MRRGKLPAYGRDLITLRDAGQHPDRVWVLVGDDWSRRPVNAPSLCIKTADRAEGFDWSICAGLPVHVVDRCGDVLGVAAAVARYAAPVVVHWIYGEEDWPAPLGGKGQADVTVLMWSLRERVKSGFRFTCGWSDDLDADYRARCATYSEVLRSDVQRKLAEIEVA